MMIEQTNSYHKMTDKDQFYEARMHALNSAPTMKQNSPNINMKAIQFFGDQTMLLGTKTRQLLGEEMSPAQKKAALQDAEKG